MLIVENDRQTHLDLYNKHFMVNIPFSRKDLSADHMKTCVDHLVVRGPPVGSHFLKYSYAGNRVNKTLPRIPKT